MFGRIEPTEALDGNDPELEHIVQRFRDEFKLGPRNRMTERAYEWHGMRYEGRLVAITGDYRSSKQLEVTDAYHDGTREGKTALAAMMLGYYEMLKRGEIDALAHMCLFENAEQWQAVVRETGDMPLALYFVHKRK